MQIGVARNPPLEHAFGLLLKDLAHNNWGSRVERRSTISSVVRNTSFADRPPLPSGSPSSPDGTPVSGSVRQPETSSHPTDSTLATIAEHDVTPVFSSSWS